MTQLCVCVCVCVCVYVCVCVCLCIFECVLRGLGVHVGMSACVGAYYTPPFDKTWISLDCIFRVFMVEKDNIQYSKEEVKRHRLIFFKKNKFVLSRFNFSARPGGGVVFAPFAPLWLFEFQT